MLSTLARRSVGFFHSNRTYLTRQIHSAEAVISSAETALLRARLIEAQSHALTQADKRGEASDFCIRQVGEFKFFNMKYEAQTAEKTRELKPQLLHEMGLPPNATVVQIIGDSVAFEAEAQLWVKQQLINRILEIESANENDVLYLFGLACTQYNSEGVATGCTNTTFSQAIEELRKLGHDISNRTVGNVLSSATPMVIREFNSRVSKFVNNFWMVWSQEGTGFGADTVSSDHMLGQGDTVICLDSGPQSSSQLQTLANNGCSIELFENLRDHALHGQEFFSAASFIQHLQQCRYKIDSPTAALQAIIDYCQLPNAAIEELASRANIKISHLRFPSNTSRLYANVSEEDFPFKTSTILAVFNDFLNLPGREKLQDSNITTLGTYEPSTAINNNKLA